MTLGDPVLIRCVASCLLGLAALRGEDLRLERRDPDGRFRFRTEYRAPGQRPLSLVLGGGSAKGLAHIGVLEILEEEGLPEDAITGTSAGALMGGFRAAGFTGPGLRWAFKRTDFGAEIFDSRRRTPGTTLMEEEARQATVIRLDRRPEGWDFLPGETTGQSATRLLMSHLLRADALSGGDFGRLRVPFACVASNLTTGRLELLAQGDLVQAVRASMSIPGVFRPVRSGEQQLVDGGISQNLPVFEARRRFPEAIQVAVDVSDPWDVRTADNPFSLVGRSLSFSVEAMTQLNRDAAQVLVRPVVAGSDIFDFHSQVDLLADRGREAMAALLPDLERHLYGPEGEAALPTRGWVAQGEVSPEIRQVIEDCLPAGRPWVRRDGYRLLRRLLSRGLVADAWVELPGDATDEITVHLRSCPPIRSVAMTVPAVWEKRVHELAGALALQVDRPFRATALASLQEQLLIEASLRGRPLLDFTGCSFSSQGDLRIVVQEAPLSAVEIETAHLRPASRGAMHQLLVPLLGQGVDTGRLSRLTLEMEQALNLQNPSIRMRTGPEGQDWMLRAAASDERRVQVNAAAAYETTWGLHGVLDTWFRDLWVKGLEAGLHLQGDRIQAGVELAARWAAPSDPSQGVLVSADWRRHRFEGDPLLGYFGEAPDPGGYQALIENAADASKNLTAGLFKRFSRDAKGLAQILVQFREAVLKPPSAPWIRNRQTVVQGTMEWDNLDRHTFPTEGLMIRAWGLGGKVHTWIPDAPVQAPLNEHVGTTYLHVRALAKDVAGPVGADIALEAGLGWHTLLVPDRQFILGGDASLIGTPSTRFLAPNFAILRAGLPIPLRKAFGGHIQVIPRFDIGRFSQEPTGLWAGMRVIGQGVVVQGSVGKFFIETGWGQVQVRPAGPGPLRRESQFNMLVGARPFDLWSRK